MRGPKARDEEWGARGGVKGESKEEEGEREVREAEDECKVGGRLKRGLVGGGGGEYAHGLGMRALCWLLLLSSEHCRPLILAERRAADGDAHRPALAQLRSKPVPGNPSVLPARRAVAVCSGGSQVFVAALAAEISDQDQHKHLEAAEEAK